MKDGRKRLAFALAALLLCAVCAQAAADTFAVSGNAGETYVFYVECYGYATLELTQQQGLGRVLTYGRSETGEVAEMYEWGKYHVYVQAPGYAASLYDWDGSVSGGTFALSFGGPGIYTVRIVPYTAGEMGASWQRDSFIGWKAYPQWTVGRQWNCAARASYTPGAWDGGQQTSPPRPNPGRTVYPIGWDTQFKPGTTGEHTYNDKRYLRLENLADDNWRTSFDWLIWSAEREDGIPEITAFFNRETISSVGIRNGYLRDAAEYLLFARATALTVKIRDAYGREYRASLRIPEEYSTEYRMFSLGGTYTDVMSVEFFLDSFRYEPLADIEHRYVIHIADICFYN